MALGKDANQVRSGAVLQAIAALHNADLGVLHQHHYDNINIDNIDAALRYFA